MPYINIILGLVYTIASDLFKSQTEKGCGVATQRNVFSEETAGSSGARELGV